MQKGVSDKSVTRVPNASAWSVAMEYKSGPTSFWGKYPIIRNHKLGITLKQIYWFLVLALSLPYKVL